MNIAKLYQNAAALAPMAGAADSAFRGIARECGAAFTVSEMVSARALARGDKKSQRLMEHGPREKPFGVQLFGFDPNDVERAVKIAALGFSPDFIDINMGCPAPKITCSGAGAALMRTPDLAADLLRAAKSASPLPVTAKIRSGPDEEKKNAAELAELLERAGADGIAVHGRTWTAMYRPPADLESIRLVKRSVGIPVLGNGDIRSGADALRMLRLTGCDGVMVGRGALGNPFLFGEIVSALSGTPFSPPPLAERLSALRRQITEAAAQKGEYTALREARKHAAWYIKGFRGAAALRGNASSLETLSDLDAFISLALGTISGE